MKQLLPFLFSLLTIHGYAQEEKTFYSIEQAWKNPIEVKILVLKKDGLTSIPKEVFYMTNLEELYLEKNSIVKIPKEIGQLKKLRILDLDQNKIDSVPAEIGLLTELIELDLDQNRLVYLPPEIGSLKKLTSLDLHLNDLVTLPKEIGQLVSLTDLRIYNNKLRSLPVEIGQLNSLTSLNINYNELTELPISIGNLINLTSLSVVKNNISSIPQEIKNCQKLEIIDLQDNHLKSIPEGLGNLSNLRELFLNKNEIVLFPEKFGFDNSIYHFQLDHNQISALPEDLKLPHLKTFTISFNSLEKLPENLNGLDSLIDLNISHNKITELKSNLSTLKNLISLNVSNNSIKSIPENISSLTKLKYLDLKYNQIEKLPQSIESIFSLLALELYGNLFNKEIKSLKKLINLSDLNISEEQLKYVPKEVEKFNHLDYICIEMSEGNCTQKVKNGNKHEPDYPIADIRVPEVKLVLSKSGWINYLVDGISRGANYENDEHKDEMAYELYRQLEYAANNDDLIKLLEHEDPTVRVYAFQILDERNYDGIFEFTKKHLTDEMQEVSHNNWRYDLSLGSYYVKAKSLTTQQRFEIDSLILFSAGYYYEMERILTTYDTITTFHDGILKLAEKNKDAAYYLAKYKRKSDLPFLQDLLYKNATFMGNIPDYFPDETFLETIEKLFEDKKYCLTQVYSLINYNNLKSVEILNKMIESDFISTSKIAVNLDYVMREIENKKESNLDTLYFKLWKKQLIYPDSIILERLYKTNPDSTLLTLKKLLLKNPSTYEDEKLKYCLKFLYEKNQVWAVTHYSKVIIDFGKISGRYSYGRIERHYLDFAYSVSNKKLAETFLEIFNSAYESIIAPEKLTHYILPFKDPGLNEKLIQSLVNHPSIHAWVVDEFKESLKKYELLDDIISLQEKRKPTIYGNWKIETWKYGTSEKMAPNWAYIELGFNGNYLKVGCTTKSIGKFHYDSTLISFDTIIGSSMNWEDDYVTINNGNYLIRTQLMTSAVPNIIDICRDTAFDDNETMGFLNEIDKILQGGVKYILTDTSLYLKGNGEIKFSLKYNYLTDWKKPIEHFKNTQDWVNDYVNKEHFLTQPPTSISGIPIAKYLARNDIDSLSKLFIQGKHGLKEESYDENRYLLDSIYTKNPQTKAFYFYQLNRIIGMAKTDFHYYSQLRNDLSSACSHFFLNDPCYFFQMVKSGPYSYNYMEWKKYLQRGLWNSEIETLQKSGTEYRIKTDCEKYLPEFKSIVKWMETYYDEDAPPYDGH